MFCTPFFRFPHLANRVHGPRNHFYVSTASCSLQLRISLVTLAWEWPALTSSRGTHKFSNTRHMSAVSREEICLSSRSFRIRVGATHIPYVRTTVDTILRNQIPLTFLCSVCARRFLALCLGGLQLVVKAEVERHLAAAGHRAEVHVFNEDCRGMTSCDAFRSILVYCAMQTEFFIAKISYLALSRCHLVAVFR